MVKKEGNPVHEAPAFNIRNYTSATQSHGNV